MNCDEILYVYIICLWICMWMCKFCFFFFFFFGFLFYCSANVASMQILSEITLVKPIYDPIVADAKLTVLLLIPFCSTWLDAISDLKIFNLSFVFFFFCQYCSFYLFYRDYCEIFAGDLLIFWYNIVRKIDELYRIIGNK